jgi:hypothetical protein
MATREMDIIKRSASGLSETEKIQLIEFLTKSLRHGKTRSKQLQYGKYHDSGRSVSSFGDFKIAEWNEADLDLNGN